MIDLGFKDPINTKHFNLDPIVEPTSVPVYVNRKKVTLFCGRLQGNREYLIQIETSRELAKYRRQGNKWYLGSIPTAEDTAANTTPA